MWITYEFDGKARDINTSLAIVQVLESKGILRKDTEKYAADTMYKFIEPQIETMKKLASHGWFVRMLKFTIRFQICYACAIRVY